MHRLLFLFIAPAALVTINVRQKLSFLFPRTDNVTPSTGDAG